MNITRGIIAGLIGAVVGVVAPVLVIGLYTILYWYFNDTRGIDRRDDITVWQWDAFQPLVGLLSMWDWRHGSRILSNARVDLL